MQKNDFITEKFFSHLIKNGVSLSTIKNYKSDIKHFSDWMIRSVKSLGVFAETLTEALPFINNSTALLYKSFLENSAIPGKTINRKLSSLRKLSTFLVENQVIHFDFTSQTKNIQTRPVKEIKAEPYKVEGVINDFENFLIKEKISKNTIKNYLSDIKQFFIWIESQKLSN